MSNSHLYLHVFFPTSVLEKTFSSQPSLQTESFFLLEIDKCKENKIAPSDLEIFHSFTIGLKYTLI